MAVSKRRNPTHGSGWIVQIRPTKRNPNERTRIPPTEVGGLFRSNLRPHRRRMELKSLSLSNVFWRFDSEAGSEQSTNFRWWDSKTRSVLACRLDLNHPPTSVGGIPEFSHNLEVGDFSGLQR